MSIKCLALLCWVTLVCAAMTNPRASAAPSSAWNPDETMATMDDVALAAAHARALGCQTPSCKAIIIIHEVFAIRRYEEGDANGVASLYLGSRPRIAGRRLDHVLLEHRELYGPVCATATKMISQFHRSPEIGEWGVPVLLLVHGVEMDLRDHGHCARDRVDALPREPANNQVRIDARDLCLAGDENHHQPKTACAILNEWILKAEP